MLRMERLLGRSEMLVLVVELCVHHDVGGEKVALTVGLAEDDELEEGAVAVFVEFWNVPCCRTAWC